MKKIAVTGASGHIGNNVCRHLLDEEYNLKVLTRYKNEKSLEGLELEIISGDLFSPDSLDELMRESEIVIHLAGKVSIYPKDKEEIFKTNIEGVKNVVDACVRNRVRKLIHFSSVHAHKGYGPEVPINEQTPYSDNESSPYDFSKAQGEQIVLKARERNLETVIINPTGVIGPHDYNPSYSGKLFTDIYTGKMGSIVSGGFDWVDARDLAIAISSIIKKDIKNEQFLLSGNWASIKQLADRVCYAKGKKYRGITSPLKLAYIGLPFINLYSKITGTLPLYTTESLKAIREGSKDVDHSHAKKMLDYSPRPFNESIDDTMEWLVNHYQLNHG